MGVVGVGVWIAVDFLGRGDNGETQPVSQTTTPEEPTPEKSPSESVSPTSEEPTPPEEKSEPEKKPKKLITEGVTVQVLNGTKDPEAGNAMSDQLQALGFQVVAVETSSKNYKLTTVLWSTPASKEAAERLADRFGWEVDEKPGNLAATVSMHVVVGADEATKQT